MYAVLAPVQYTRQITWVIAEIVFAAFPDPHETVSVCPENVTLLTSRMYSLVYPETGFGSAIVALFESVTVAGWR